MPFRKAASGACQLVCLPHAGGSASAFRSWQAVSAQLDIVAVQLPGREDRFPEPLLYTLSDVLDGLIPALASVTSRRYALFGHSMGALLAFEAAHRLSQLKLPAPEALFVGSFPAPDLATDREPLYDLPDDKLTDWMIRVDGISPDALAYPDLLRLMLPMTRADLRIVDAYRWEPRQQLDCPIRVFVGDEDPEVSLAASHAWRRHTSRYLGTRPLPGGHFCVHDHVGLVIASISQALGLPSSARPEPDRSDLD
jgi:surfactin synthase thioesterase subunit